METRSVAITDLEHERTPAGRTLGSGTIAFVDRLPDRGDAPAVVADDATLTYSQLAERVDQVADGLGSTRRLVLLTPTNRVESLVAYLGALRGGHPVLLAPPGDQRALTRLIGTYDPDVIVDEAGEQRERRPGTAHDLHPDLALLLSTSGSTGSPRLVRLSHDNVQANAAAIAESLGLSSTDRAATALPPHYCYGLSVLHSHLHQGAALVLGEGSVVDPAWWDRFRRFGATSFAGVPYSFELLERVGFESMSLPTLRQVTQAGGRLAPDRVRHWAEVGRRQGWELIVMYGQTEATARMAYLPPELATRYPSSVGVAVPGGSFRIDAPDGGEEGELVYQGPNVMLGYADGVDDLADGRSVDELRTGDIARWNEAGLIEIVGRASRFLKLFGLRVDLDRVEADLASLGHAVVCTGDDERLVVATTSTRPSDPDVLARLVTERIGLPRRSVVVVGFDELPRTASGKPDLPAIRAAALGAAADHPAAPRPDAAPEDLGTAPASGRRAPSWAIRDVLGAPDAPGDATFVSLGGDSLSYVEASIRLEAALGTVPLDWHLRTLDELDAMAPIRRALPRMELNVVLRAISIVLVVAGHVGISQIVGGAHLLLAIAGYNFARFGLAASGTRAHLRSIGRLMARIAIPSLAFIAPTVAVDERFTLANLALVNTIASSGAWRHWYIEVILQVLVLVALVTALPRARDAERRWPLGVALALLALALVARELPTLGDPLRPTFTTQGAAWLFALGWAVQRARTIRHRLLLTAVTVLVVPGYFGVPWREAVVLVGVLALLWVRRVPVPRGLNRVLGLVAGASLYIYLSHWLVFRDLDRLAGGIVAVAGGVAVGIVLWLAAERARSVLRAARSASVGWASGTA